MSIARRDFVTLGVASTCLPASANGLPDESRPSRFPALETVGSRFQVVLVADPQIEGVHTKSMVPRNSQHLLSQIIEETNRREPPPAFVLFNGDLINSAVPVQIENFITRAKRLRPLTILTHGNHDGHHPYPEFRAMQTELNGTDDVHFSWNCGEWHFLTIPCNLPKDGYPDELLTWLEHDLEANASRPTMAFIHLHLMPQGLTQLEWYTYDREFRKRILDIFAKVGNVRYAICGHVHNGIQASVKTAWSYRGTNFLTAPTCTASRNFGEEFPAFAAGQPTAPDQPGGGYYLVLHFDGADVRIEGRLAHVDEIYSYDQEFRPYDNQEPLWFRPLSSVSAQPALQNGAFEAGLSNWLVPYRYKADQEPGFIAEIRPRDDQPGTKAAYLFTRNKGEPWAHDDLIELYQKVSLANVPNPAIRMDARAEEGNRQGAGYIRLSLFSKGELRLLTLLDFGDGDREDNRYFGINTMYYAFNRKMPAWILADWGEKRQALYIPAQLEPERWTKIVLLPAELLNQATGDPDRYASLEIDEVVVAVGTWSQKTPSSRNGAWFDQLEVSPAAPEEQSSVDGKEIEVGNALFRIPYGVAQRERQRQERPNRRAKQA